MRDILDFEDLQVLAKENLYYTRMICESVIEIVKNNSTFNRELRYHISNFWKVVLQNRRSGTVSDR